jgi:hypothetical protein
MDVSRDSRFLHPTLWDTSFESKILKYDEFLLLASRSVRAFTVKAWGHNTISFNAGDKSSFAGLGFSRAAHLQTSIGNLLL